MLFPVGMEGISRAVTSWTVISLKWWKTCGRIWAFSDGQTRHTDWSELRYKLQSCWRPETWGTLQAWACVCIFLCNSNTRMPKYLILPESCLVSEVGLVSLQASFSYGWMLSLARKSVLSENQIMLRTVYFCGTELGGSSLKRGTYYKQDPVGRAQGSWVGSPWQYLAVHELFFTGETSSSDQR